MKVGKELNLETLNNYNVSFGSVNNKQPNSVYVDISTWANPENKDVFNYLRVIKNLNKEVRQSLYNFLELNEDLPFVNNKTITDLDIRESGIKYGKRSYMNCGLTLYLKNDLSIVSKEMNYYITKIVNKIILDIFEKNKNFKFYNKKK